MAAGLFD
jgi:hypothetical protein